MPYTLSLHDALPISHRVADGERGERAARPRGQGSGPPLRGLERADVRGPRAPARARADPARRAPPPRVAALRLRRLHRGRSAPGPSPLTAHPDPTGARRITRTLV